MSRELIYIEMDCPKCSLVFGTAPCTASGVQCKNTPATCQDLQNYTAGAPQIVRWVKSASYVPSEPYAVPSLNSVSSSSQRINPGENLGKRERVTATFFNHRHNDIDLDPYVSLRPYNPHEQGTYWGKFAAIHPNVQGYPVRVARGREGLPYAEFEVSHYIADVGKIAGDKTGYSLTAKDVLDFAEGNKTLCPAPSRGLLAANITNAATSVTLTPEGIGNSDYPAAFDASIGEEAMTCTRSGDVVTFTQRGAFGTSAVDHDEGDTLQVMESFISKSASEILERLLQFTDTPIEYYNKTQWDSQVAAVTSPNLTSRIAEPTEVFKLIQDLMIDLALDIHTDVVGKKIIMRFLLGQLPTATITDDNMDNPSANFYSDKRVDLFFMSFGRKNPLLEMNVPSNYPTTIVRPSSNPVSLLTGNPAAIRKHYSRWIPSTLRPLASTTADFIVSRYETAPRGITCTMKAEFAPSLAQVVTVKTSIFEDAYGNTPAIPMQVVSASKAQGNYKIEMEEIKAELPAPGDDIVITLTENALNMQGFLSLRAIYDSIYPAGVPANSVVIFEADIGVVYGSTPARAFAVVDGSWPNDATLKIKNLKILGHGGRAGISVIAPFGQDGGGALYTRTPIELIDCTIGGGGGGGGGFEATSGNGFFIQGGGGAGYEGGQGFNNGTQTTGGAGQLSPGTGQGGAGGNLGQNGTAGNGFPGTSYPGGVAGTAIDGASFITATGTTTITGAQIN